MRSFSRLSPQTSSAALPILGAKFEEAVEAVRRAAEIVEAHREKMDDYRD